MTRNNFYVGQRVQHRYTGQKGRIDALNCNHGKHITGAILLHWSGDIEGHYYDPKEIISYKRHIRPSRVNIYRPYRAEEGRKDKIWYDNAVGHFIYKLYTKSTLKQVIANCKKYGWKHIDDDGEVMIDYFGRKDLHIIFYMTMTC